MQLPEFRAVTVPQKARRGPSAFTRITDRTELSGPCGGVDHAERANAEGGSSRSEGGIELLTRRAKPRPFLELAKSHILKSPIASHLAACGAIDRCRGGVRAGVCAPRHMQICRESATARSPRAAVPSRPAALGPRPGANQRSRSVRRSGVVAMDGPAAIRVEPTRSRRSAGLH